MQHVVGSSDSKLMVPLALKKIQGFAALPGLQCCNGKHCYSVKLLVQIFNKAKNASATCYRAQHKNGAKKTNDKVKNDCNMTLSSLPANSVSTDQSQQQEGRGIGGST